MDYCLRRRTKIRKQKNFFMRAHIPILLLFHIIGYILPAYAQDSGDQNASKDISTSSTDGQVCVGKSEQECSLCTTSDWQSFIQAATYFPSIITPQDEKSTGDKRVYYFTQNPKGFVCASQGPFPLPNKMYKIGRYCFNLTPKSCDCTNNKDLKNLLVERTADLNLVSTDPNFGEVAACTQDNIPIQVSSFGALPDYGPYYLKQMTKTSEAN